MTTFSRQNGPRPRKITPEIVDILLGGPARACLTRPLPLPSPAAQRATLESKRALIDKVDCFIFDCDGVIWRGDSVIEGVPETLDFLRSLVRMFLLCSDMYGLSSSWAGWASGSCAAAQSVKSSSMLRMHIATE